MKDMSLKDKVVVKFFEKQYTNIGILAFAFATITLDLLLGTGGTGGYSMLVVGVIFSFLDTLGVVTRHLISKKS